MGQTLRGGLWGKRCGAPVFGTAGSYQLHSGDTAKPFCEAGGASVKAQLRKGRKRCAERESGDRNGEKRQGTPGPEIDEKVLSMARYGRPWMPEQRDIPSETVASPDQSSFS